MAESPAHRPSLFCVFEVLQRDVHHTYSPLHSPFAALHLRERWFASGQEFPSPVHSLSRQLSLHPLTTSFHASDLSSDTLSEPAFVKAESTGFYSTPSQFRRLIDLRVHYPALSSLWSHAKYLRYDKHQTAAPFGPRNSKTSAPAR